MVTESSLTCNHQTAYRCLSSNHASRRSPASPYPPVVGSTPTPRPATSSQSHDPPIFELFTTLLFDRQKAYQSRSRIPSALPSTPVAGAERTKPTERNTGTQIQHTPPILPELHVHKQEEKQPSRHHVPLRRSLKPAMLSKVPTVSKRRGRPVKPTPTKDAGRTTTDKSRKRSAPARVTPRVTKRQKPEANSKQKLNHTGSMGSSMTTALTTTSDKDREVITISDSEEDVYQRMQRGETSYKEGESAGFGASKITIHEDDDDDDVNPGAPTTTANAEPIQFTPMQSPVDLFDQTPRHGPSLNNLQNKMARAEAEHTQEKEQLRQELDTAKAELDKIKRLHEKDKGDSELLQVGSSNITRQETQRLQTELETAQDSLRAAVRERDQLSIDIDNSRASNDQLVRELQEEKRKHKEILQDIMKSTEPISDSSNDFLVTENGRLRTENESLRAAARPPRPPMPQSTFLPTSSSISTPPSSQLSQLSGESPYPSIFASQAASPAPSTPPPVTTEERKDENIRKVYIKVKRRLDTLQLAAVNLTNSTKGMDLSSFGQFGKYLRQLKTALDEDAKKSVEKREHEDAK